MQNLFKHWIKQYFSNYEASLLLIWLLSIVFIVIVGGRVLAPVITSLIIAYLMQGMVNFLVNRKVAHKISVYIVFSFFMAILFAGIFFIIPIIWKQLGNLINSLPRMLNKVDGAIALVSNKYPFLLRNDVSSFINSMKEELASYSQYYIATSYTKILELMHILVYCILVPFLVFFFLRDKDMFLGLIKSTLPNQRRLIMQVASEMNRQIANYIRGKGIEILVAGLVTYVVFLFFGLNYAELLAILVGLSVLIPIVGVLVVSIPVILVALFQWGGTEQFLALTIAFAVIQILDGNVLVPVLFSDAVGLHPVIIIISVLIFGSIWGVLGVFFAIPLATLLKAVINAWPVNNE
jgi:putative permease